MGRFIKNKVTGMYGTVYREYMDGDVWDGL